MKVQIIDGIEYCHKHDSFAIEGYDWSDICSEKFHGAQGPCDLSPMYAEHRELAHPDAEARRTDTREVTA